MAVFDLKTWVDEKYRKQAYEINNQYFTVDTAAPDEVYDWVNHNRLMVTYALKNDRVEGFFNVMPLTPEAAELFERHEIREEDITIHDILPPEDMHLAQHLYFPAIAVRDYHRYTSKQCVAALMGGLMSHFEAVYLPDRLQRLYANPTTYPGNLMVRKLGLQPLQTRKGSLKSNDLYYADFDDELFKRLRHYQKHYARFIGQNCWIDGSYADKLKKQK